MCGLTNTGGGFARIGCAVDRCADDDDIGAGGRDFSNGGLFDAAGDRQLDVQPQSGDRAEIGEGRLSGVVLLALPPVLFIVVYRLNPDYCSVLFTDPMGKKMLLVAVVMQMLGALWIRKIINIKV